MRIYTGRSGTRVSMGPAAALLVGMFVWPVKVLWATFKLTIPVFLLVAAVTWRLGKWTVQATGEGVRWAWYGIRLHRRPDQDEA